MKIYETQALTEKEEVALSDNERQLCEIWTRVMGYHRPVSEFNLGKQSEFYERKYFVLKTKELQ